MRVLFMGRKQAAADSLEWLSSRGHSIVGVITDSHLEGSPTAAMARKLGLPLLTLEQALADIEEDRLHFDLGVSVVYWRILPQSFIDVAQLGVINFHPAPLPDWKGSAGYNVAILEGLSEWGISAHYVDAGIDTGPIIEVDRFPIDAEKETTQSLEATSMERTVEQFKRVIQRVETEAGLLSTTPNVGGVHISKKNMEEMKIVNPGDDIDRKIRAFWFPPYSGATVNVDGKPYTLVNQQILQALAESCGPHKTSLTTAPSESPIRS